MGKPFKVSTPTPGPEPSVETQSPPPAAIFKEARDTGLGIDEVGRAHEGIDGEAPIPWPAAATSDPDNKQSPAARPFKLR